MSQSKPEEHCISKHCSDFQVLRCPSKATITSNSSPCLNFTQPGRRPAYRVARLLIMADLQRRVAVSLASPLQLILTLRLQRENVVWLTIFHGILLDFSVRNAVMQCHLSSGGMLTTSSVRVLQRALHPACPCSSDPNRVNRSMPAPGSCHQLLSARR